MNKSILRLVGAALFAGASLVGAVAHATPMTPLGVYDVSSVNTGGNDHTLWLNGHSGSDYWQFVDGAGAFTFNRDGTARLNGTLAQNGTPGNTLDLNAVFTYRPQGRGAIDPKIEGGGTNTDEWDYFDLTSATLSGMVGGHIVNYALSIRPSEELPAQLGIGANAKDPFILGFSSWIFWDDGSGNRAGDINLRLRIDPNGILPPVPLPAGGLLLLTALGAGAMVARRRRTAS